LRITFLGTGTSHGVPMIGCDCTTCRSTDSRDKRWRASIYIETDDGQAVLVDAGPDIREQSLAFDIRRVDAIVFTHGHADHIMGLDDIRRFNVIQQRPMACFGDEATLNDLRRTFFYVFDPNTPKGGGIPQLELFRIAGPFCIGRQEIIPVPIWHGKRRILGLRMGRFAYLTDCSEIPEESWSLLNGLDLLVLDALRETPHPTHFSLAEAIDVTARIAPRRACFTHMCHNLRHADTCAKLPPGMELAYDGLVVEI
jgi:phosphoribosyl 1,2-cyclic phosphate phosphodiesterase